MSQLAVAKQLAPHVLHEVSFGVAVGALAPYPASHLSHIPKPFVLQPPAQLAEQPFPHVKVTGLKAYPDAQLDELH